MKVDWNSPLISRDESVTNSSSASIVRSLMKPYDSLSMPSRTKHHPRFASGYSSSNVNDLIRIR